MATEYVLSDDSSRMISTYYSVTEYVEAARREVSRTGLGLDYVNPAVTETTSYGQAIDMALNGWPDELPDALRIAEDAVKLCDQETSAFTFAPVFDVAGGDVDVARYLSGEPECMVDYPLTPTSKVGRVITLCVGLNTSIAISEETVK